ncbi:hypothetical protein [Nocardioides dongkuii]|uniref:hypothetical protein n=1 Tax=Nocardioides dongkuii TaxID=2760089 RepID=UPI0015FAC5B5|nr:hypothetical protein [Nocardioides dongkuii]
MFTHTCTACAQRQLIFLSQVSAVADSPRGPLATFTCWCGAEQTALMSLTSSSATPVEREPALAA